MSIYITYMSHIRLYLYIYYNMFIYATYMTIYLVYMLIYVTYT